MQRFSKFLWLWFAILLVPAWLLQKHFEPTDYSDYLGVWYTALCAGVYAIVGVGTVGLLLLLKNYYSQTIGSLTMG